MCIFCVSDDAPFYLRKSTAFPRKLIAESVEADAAPCEKAEAAQSAFGPHAATTEPESRPKAPSRRPDEDGSV